MQFKSFISKNITEAVALTPAQLDANNSKTGRARIDILRQLVVQQKPLELAKGGSIVVSNIDDALVHIANFKKNPLHYGKKGFPLETDSGTYMSNQLAKSEVFGGGGGGAGSGEKQTRRNEVHNAVMMHAMLEHGYNQQLEFFNRDIMKSA